MMEIDRVEALKKIELREKARMEGILILPHLGAFNSYK